MGVLCRALLYFFGWSSLASSAGGKSRLGLLNLGAYNKAAERLFEGGEICALQDQDLGEGLFWARVTEAESLFLIDLVQDNDKWIRNIGIRRGYVTASRERRFYSSMEKAGSASISSILGRTTRLRRACLRSGRPVPSRAEISKRVSFGKV